MKDIIIHTQSFSFAFGKHPEHVKNKSMFVFDCRCIDNPGRIEEYKKSTGLELPVREYLETKTEMPVFIKSIQNFVDVALKNSHAKGDFEEVIFCFGCTGGQHRSVYVADTIAEYIKSTYDVSVICTHHQQGIITNKQP